MRDTSDRPNASRAALAALLYGSDRVAISLWAPRTRVAVGWNVLADGLFGFSDGRHASSARLVRYLDAKPLPFVHAHPSVGALTMHRVRMLLLGTSLTMWVHAPADDETTRKFEQLRELGQGCAFVETSQ